MDSGDLCRLCFSTQSQQLNIFKQFESNLNVAKIIDKHIGEVSDSDALPKTICTKCWSITEAFHKFHESVKLAQANYLDGLVKCELPNDVIYDYLCCDSDEKPPNVDEVMKNHHVFAEGLNDQLNESNFNRLDSDNDDDYVSSKGSDSPSEPFDARNILNDSNRINSIISENFDLSCDICHIDLKTLKRAIFHYERAHSIADGYIKCCGLKFKRQILVDDHIRWHLNPEIFKCKQCGKTLRTKKSLSTHLTEHRYIRKFICDLCGKIYTQKDKIKRHLFTHITSFECKLCPKRCSTKARLEAHEALCHNPETTAGIRRQLNALKEIKTMTLSGLENEKIISKHFDMACDICGDALTSLQQAQFHYMHEHQMPNGYIKCCGIKLKKNQNVNGHIVWHMNPEMFKCIICGKSKKTVQTLRQHLAVHLSRQGPKDNKFGCIECGKAFLRKDVLNKHLLNVHKIVCESKKYLHFKDSTVSNALSNDMRLIEYFDMTCDVCGTILDSLQHAKMHYLDEHCIADGYIKCCDLKFKEVKQINDHLEFHSNPDIFKCHFCEKTLPSKDRLNTHMSRHRIQESKRHTCTVCEKSFATNHLLQKHARTHEKNEKLETISCGFCLRRFTSEKLQKSHEERIHQKNEQKMEELCDICAKPFANRKAVLSHIRAKHSPNSQERVECEICQASLSQHTIKAHMRRHIADPRKCPQCDKISPNQHALACHIREVHTERIHKCHLCEKSFKAAVALKDHVATHTGEKLYKCSYCPESFIWRPNCYSHQKKAHPNEWNQSQTKKKAVTKV